MNLATFRDLYPAFKNAPAAPAQDWLDQATREVDPEVYGDKTEDAIGLLAAHKGALSPFGQTARLADAKLQTTWGREFERIRDLQACALRIF